MIYVAYRSNKNNLEYTYYINNNPYNMYPLHKGIYDINNIYTSNP